MADGSDEEASHKVMQGICISSEHYREQLLESLHAQLDVECKIKDGAENLLNVFSQGVPSSVESNGQQKKSINARDQLRKQVQEELDAAETKISKLRNQIDALIQQINSQVASTSRKQLDQVSPGGGLGLLRHGRPSPRSSPHRSSSRKLEESNSTRGETDVFAIKSHAIALMQTLQSLAPAVSSRMPIAMPTSSSRPSSAGTTSNGNSPMGPPITPSMTRSAQRARAAAFASTKGSHARTPSHATGLGDIPRRRIEVMSRLVEVMEKSARLRYELPVEELIACAFPCLADQAGKEVRASAYRLLRHAMVRPPWNLVRACRQKGLDLYITRSLLRDSRFDLEKEQAIKLIRTIMECGCSDTREEDLISVSVIRALVAAADHPDEKLRHIYIETLAELAIHDTSLLIRGGGLRTLLQSLSDGPYELAPAMMTLLLTCVDLPGTRKFFRPGLDLEIALSSLTEAKEDEESLQSTAQVVSIMLRSWTGLFYLSLYNYRAIKSLILALQVNSTQVQEKILDILCSLLNIKSNERAKASASSHQRFRPHPRTNKICRLNLYDHYLALLVLILIECGITEAIIHVLETNNQLSRKSTLLMGHLTQIAGKHLPSEYGVRLHALPDVFSAVFTRSSETGSSRERGKGQERAAMVLNIIEDYEREQVRDKVSTHNDANRDRSNSATTNIRSTTQVDENTFRSLLLESNVLNTKDYIKWNIDALMHIFEAIQIQPKRLEETVRLGKLIKRVLAFFHPFSLQYATLANTSRSQRYTKLGCLIFQTLASSQDGIRILLDDKVLKEIRESLQTDLMTSQRSQETLIVGYFEMLGVLTRTNEGRQLMHKSRLFTALYRAIEENGTDEITKAILIHFDFDIEGHCRVLLSKILTSSHPKIRLHATQTIADKIRANASRWLVSLLVTQLYDAATSVRELASNLLLEVCSSSTKALEMIVSLRPMLEETSHSLLLKFISTSIGLRYLLQGDYIDREMDEWFNKRNHLYAVQLEVLLARGFNIDRDVDDVEIDWDGCLPAHFYGELAKTPEGCQVLQQKGHFAEFAHFIRQHGMEEEDVEVINKLKSVLWAVGNIAATEGGLSFLEEEDLIVSIVNIAEQSPVYSLRGTCYFILGLISTTQQGAELVEDQGWLTSAAKDVNVYCIPSPTFLQIQPWKSTLPYTSIAVLEPETRIEKAIMLNVSNLGNSILANKASRTLSKLKQKNRRIFVKKGIELFTRSLFIIHNHYIRQAIRRYIWELFEIKLDQECVEQLIEARIRLLSGKRPKLSQLQAVAEGNAYDIELRRHGDEVLGTNNEGMDEEEMSDFDGEEEEEEEEEDSILTEGEFEAEGGDEQSEMSSIQPPLHYFQQQTPGRMRGSRKSSLGISHHHHHFLGPSLAPKRKLVGGFTKPESLILSQSLLING